MNPEKITETKGKFFSITFTKADGSVRVMVARTGVKKGVKGTGTKKPLADNLIKVYDVIAKGFRTINLDRVRSFKCGDSKYTNELFS